MNILIKLMSIVSLVIAPTLAQLHPINAEAKQEKKVEFTIKKMENDSTSTSVTVKANEEKLETLIQELKKAGIITGNNLDLQVKDDKIFVNGKELDADVAKKYSEFLFEGKQVEMSIKTTDKKQ